MLLVFVFAALCAIRVNFRKTYALVVDDLNNGGELAILGSSIDEHDAADLNESPGGSFDLVSSSVPIL